MTERYRFQISIKKEDMTKDLLEISKHIGKVYGIHHEDLNTYYEVESMLYNVYLSGLIENHFQRISEIIWKFMGVYCELDFNVQYVDRIPSDDFTYSQKEYDEYFMKQEEQKCLENQ